MGVGVFLARRIAALAATLLATSFIVYGAVDVAPGSPLDAVTGGRPLPPSTLHAIAREYGFDKPFLTRYWDWLTGAAHGDFGRSIVFRQDVSSLIQPRIGTTVFLVTYAAVLILAVGVALGVVSALRKGTVDTARSRGIPERLVVRRHVLRNALIPITTVAGLTVASLIAGAVVVENAFALNGLGSYLVQAVGQKDIPVVQAICLLLVAAFIIVNTVVDLLYAVIDPRIDLASGGR